MRPLQRWLKPRVPHNAWCHGRLQIRVNQACVTALTPWKNPRWMKKGVAMGLVHSRKVVTTDASNKGWGALCDVKPTFGHWSKAEKGFHINCLEMLAVCRACQFFLPDLIGRHVLIRSDNMSVVSYINHQGTAVKPAATPKCMVNLAAALFCCARIYSALRRSSAGLSPAFTKPIFFFFFFNA